ncbi:uncharacterized protein LOC112572814 [Pomacea canaliculata]|uniref:uncharacterized protein LOC112572814 n=1 Tax=Pomacea canaliculata TaxID=400727 RepID=UPI000D72574C|nr:uncharacterized protein LOC112572814 [Pomacea canaliculata]XP_025108495.1 uncharacterized protein LOC112572814 [Pomacea canaliculata]XP_025108496.1 uncharacterized protein LOC112572814 [Pomacea canaliculata]
MASLPGVVCLVLLQLVALHPGVVSAASTSTDMSSEETTPDTTVPSAPGTSASPTTLSPGNSASPTTISPGNSASQRLPRLQRAHLQLLYLRDHCQALQRPLQVQLVHRVFQMLARVLEEMLQPLKLRQKVAQDHSHPGTSGSSYQPIWGFRVSSRCCDLQGVFR